MFFSMMKVVRNPSMQMEFDMPARSKASTVTTMAEKVNVVVSCRNDNSAYLHFLIFPVTVSCSCWKTWFRGISTFLCLPPPRHKMPEGHIELTLSVRACVRVCVCVPDL